MPKPSTPPPAAPATIGRKGDGRVIFLARRAAIAAMLDAGYSRRAVYDDCALAGAMSYSQFNRYIRLYFGSPNPPAGKPRHRAPAAPRPIAPAAAAATPPAAPAAAPQPVPPPPPERALWSGDLRKLRRKAARLASWDELLAPEHVGA